MARPWTTTDPSGRHTFVVRLEDYEKLQAALLVAADDLDKAANQFAGLLPDGRNQFKFAEKAKRAREAADA